MNLSFAFKRGPAWLKHSYDALRNLAKDVKQSDLLVHAGSMAYMTLGSIVPLLALVFAVVSAFQPLAAPNATWFLEFRSFILENLAPRSGQKMIQLLERFLSNIDVAKIGFTGLLTLLIVIVILLRDIEMALNNVWHVTQTRTTVKRFLLFLMTIALGGLCLSVAVSAFSEMHLWDSLKVALEGFRHDGGSAVSIAVNLIASFIFFSFLQKIGPNCPVSVKAALMGGLVATIMIQLASFGFSIYTANSRWNQNIYEALAVVPLFLVWLYLVWFVVIFSAIVAWRVDHGFHENPGEEPRSDHCLLKNKEIRAFLPALCVLQVGKHFLEAKDHELRGKNLSSELDVPPDWIRQSLVDAEKLGLLQINRSTQDSEAEPLDPLEALIYPILPLESMTLRDLLSPSSIN